FSSTLSWGHTASGPGESCRICGSYRNAVITRFRIFHNFNETPPFCVLPYNPTPSVSIEWAKLFAVVPIESHDNETFIAIAIMVPIASCGVHLKPSLCSSNRLIKCLGIWILFLMALEVRGCSRLAEDTLRETNHAASCLGR